MTKSLFTLLLSLLFATQASAAECYALPNGVNGQGSKNTIRLPSISQAFATDSQLHLTLRNIGAINLNLKIKFYDENGQVYAPDATSFAGKFSSTNNPVADSNGSGFGFLAPNAIGVVKVDNNTVDTFTTELTWYANTCIIDWDPLISLTAERYYNSNGLLIPLSRGNLF